MDEPSQGVERSSLRAGKLEGISIPDLLWAICSAKRTGVLELERYEVRKSVFIDGGRIVFACSSDPDDRLGELLLREELIVLRDLEEALSMFRPGKRIGTLLVEAGRLSPESLVRGVLTQVQRIVHELFTWESGEYRFNEGPLPTREVITLGMRTGEILLQGIRQIRSFTRIRHSVGPAHSRYRLSGEWRERLEGLSLTDGEETLVHRLERGSETVEQLCAELFLSNFEIYQTLWAMKVLGVVVEAGRPRRAEDDPGVSGRIAGDGLAAVLVRVCRTGETGLLHASRGGLERTIHIKEGECVFATSNDINDGLLAHLLRRGVISLRDREETARRLLSNKRVGTILRELGVIDDEDLQAMVREQLAEIVHDTIAWGGGEYRFVPGELPTIEEITLVAGLESIVATALRRVTSWTRVREGCGGLNTPLQLSPAYLEVLDGMQVGAEEWEVVSCLKEAHTPLEVCEQSGLGDFAVCQILWTLRVLGAIEEAPAEEPAPPPSAEPREPSAPRQPIPVASEGAGEPFEVADVHEMMPARTAEEAEAIPASDWEPAGEDAPLDGLPVKTSGSDALRVSDEPVGAELLHDSESQAQEAANRNLAASLSRQAAVAEAEREPDAAEVVQDPDDGGDREAAAVPDRAEAEIEEVTDVAPVEAEAAPQPEPPEERRFDEDATRYIPREEVEAALGTAPAAEPEEPALTVEAVDEETGEPIETREAGPDGSWGDDPVAETLDGSPADAGVPVVDPGETTAPALPPDRGEDTSAEIPTDPDWEPPADLEAEIERFNARQRMLYRTIRAEVGAGAANFVRSCTQRLGDGTDDPFSGAELMSDGSWDVDSLKRAAQIHQLHDPASEYRRLLDVEIEMLRAHIGEPRAERLREKISDPEPRGSTPPV